MTPGRFWRRIAIVVLMVLAVWFTERGTVQRASDALFGPRVDWHNDYSMSLRLYDLIVSRHLSDVPRACLLLNIHGGDPADRQTLDVFERPTHACMGDRAAALKVLPRLFILHVDRDTGAVDADNGSPGQFHPVP